MSYLLDRKIKRKKSFKIALGVVILIVLFYFRLGVFNGLSYVSHIIFRPVLVLGNTIGEKLGGVHSFFISKNSLYKENMDLKSQIELDRANKANYDSVVQENINLKALLGRKELDNAKVSMILAAILAKPNQSPYDTLVIDAGKEQGIKEGNTVFALGNVPIGAIAETYLNSSKVVLFSNSGEKTQVVISGKDIFMEMIGRGGGNFEIILPRDLTLSKGDQVVLPGIIPYVVGMIETTISDPRDSFTKALLIAPVNIQELKFVEVEVSAS